MTVFAAASLTDALEDAAAAFNETRPDVAVRLSFASSGAAVRQILAGAPADVVVLADPGWMDRLAEAGAIRGGSRLDLLGNRLVVIAPAAGADQTDWTEAGRIVIGDPQVVPAGRYAVEMFGAMGLASTLETRLVFAADVRAVRTFVARGAAGAGVVYQSDVVGADQVRVVFTPPPEVQPRILYPAALTPRADRDAAAFLSFLTSDPGREVFSRHGFTAPAPSPT